jgi:hypothetical protein
VTVRHPVRCHCSAAHCRLSSNFFHTANNFFEAFPELEILQPAITPFPKHFRRAMNKGESYYVSLAAKFQVSWRLTRTKQLVKWQCICTTPRIVGRCSVL